MPRDRTRAPAGLRVAPRVARVRPGCGRRAPGSGARPGGGRPGGAPAPRLAMPALGPAEPRSLGEWGLPTYLGFQGGTHHFKLTNGDRVQVDLVLQKVGA
jgi:hypothetical protein